MDVGNFEERRAVMETLLGGGDASCDRVEAPGPEVVEDWDYWV